MSSYPIIGKAIREANIFWQVIRNDIIDTILPSVIAFFTAWFYNSRPWRDLPLRFFLSICYAGLYICTFCLSNQINGVEEDRINKPYRPIPSGMMTVAEARYRFSTYNIFFLVVALLLKVFWLSVGWILITAALNSWGWSQHWFSKNLLGMTIGTYILFAVHWGVATGGLQIPDSVMLYFVSMSIWAGASLPIQDFRDIEGDRVMGRKTLPLAIGDLNGRKVMAGYFLLIAPIILGLAMLTQLPFHQLFQTAGGMIFSAQLMIHWIIAYRLLKFRSSVSDDRTYHIYVILFCAAIPLVCFL